MTPQKSLAIQFSLSQGLSLSATLTFSVAKLFTQDLRYLAPIALLSFAADAYGTYSFQGQSIIGDARQEEKNPAPDSTRRQCASLALQIAYIILLDLPKHCSALYFLAYEMDAEIFNSQPEAVFYTALMITLLFRYGFALSNETFEANAMIHEKLTGIKKPFYHSIFAYCNIKLFALAGSIEHTLTHCASLLLLIIMLPSRETHITSYEPSTIFNIFLYSRYNYIYLSLLSSFFSIIAIFSFAQTYFYEAEHTRRNVSNSDYLAEEKQLPLKKCMTPFLKWGIYLLMAPLHAVDNFFSTFFSAINLFEEELALHWIIPVGIVAAISSYYTFKGIMASEVKEAMEWLEKIEGHPEESRIEDTEGHDDFSYLAMQPINESNLLTPHLSPG